MATELSSRVEDFQEALLQISNSTIVALDELWSVSDSTGDAISLLDTLPDRGAPDPEQLMDQSELRDRIADAIAALPEREKLVVALYYYENLTLREIGEVLGVTESRVSQLHTKAVLRLRSKLAGELDCGAPGASSPRCSTSVQLADHDQGDQGAVRDLAVAIGWRRCSSSSPAFA